jgi:hypothetical protein
MKAKITFLLVPLLCLSILVSCNLPGRQVTPTLTPSSTSTADIRNTATLGATITETPSPTVTSTYIPGDLGWGTIHGKVTDANTGAPIVGATVTCQHSSYTSNALCNASVVTAEDGTYAFPESYFHDTDWLRLEIQAKGYVTQTLNINFLASPWLVADFALIPESPQVMCTQPSCRPYESLACPQGNCTNGCGYVCLTPAAICTPPVCAIGTSEVYYCAGNCPGGCGTTCATFTPVP